MRHRAIAITLLAALASVACGPRMPRAAPDTQPNPCLLAGDSARPRAGPDLTLALDAPIDPTHAPIPANHAEALVFRQLYETLVFVDCEGAIRPGLARSWSTAGDRRVWEFELRETRFWDGRPVTAQHVADSWSATQGAARLGVAPESVTVLDHRRLRVATDRPAAAPYLFAEPAVAVAASPPDGEVWPVGSGPFHPAGTRDATSPLEFVAAGNAGLTVRTIHPTTARDALDGDVDLLITDDPDAVGYAKGRADLAAVALPWDRTYVLVSASGVPIVTAGDAAALRESLARDAVRADAQGAAPPFWWDRLPRGCLEVKQAELLGAGGRILHQQGDGTARGLAARIVALALLERGLRVEALAGPAFRAALRTGGDHYVLSVSRRVFDGCAAARRLVADAPWIAASLADGSARALTPLIDVRRHVLGTLPAGAVIDWDGTIRFAVDR